MFIQHQSAIDTVNAGGMDLLHQIDQFFGNQFGVARADDI